MSLSKQLRDRAYRKYRRRLKCHYCVCPLSKATLTWDHLIPKSRGGPNRLFNLRPACEPCNLAKGNMTEGEFFAPLKQSSLATLRMPFTRRAQQ